MAVPTPPHWPQRGLPLMHSTRSHPPSSGKVSLRPSRVDRPSAPAGGRPARCSPFPSVADAAPVLGGPCLTSSSGKGSGGDLTVTLLKHPLVLPSALGPLCLSPLLLSPRGGLSPTPEGSDPPSPPHSEGWVVCCQLATPFCEAGSCPPRWVGLAGATEAVRSLGRP